MQGRNLVLLAIAVIVGLIAVVLANSYFSGVEQKQAALAEQQRLARIVVATQPLEFGEKLTPQNLKLQNWPAQSVPDGAFNSIDDALKDNRVALRPIVVNEPVLASNVSGTDGRATLAALLPEGMRATSIPVDAVNGVGGFVLPGTMVDVMLVRQIDGDGADAQDQRADMVLQNVQVLAMDQNANDKDGNPRVSRVATLAVTPVDAQRLAIAQRLGTLRLTLRKIENPPYDVAAKDAPTTITSRQLGLPRIVIGARRGRGGGTAPVLAANGPMNGPVVPVYTGPAMTVVRGTEPTSYPVGTMGGVR
ncbi:Flp pilus assembly protein CpaB [Tsuneonella mangrovi]|uniref:Flp pilus assembly protein CpaB n=1 Tax=Tsuneonella mangrovi TaxID=1982042 RepID=UPI000BA2B383|nr:Flp pilus assembly protein CpaB [Tsuneonella mangrovi]